MWDLGDVAVDFYDRNCKGCEHRKPVGLPNILELVSARDRLQAEQAERDEKRRQQCASELAVRTQSRALTRTKLSAVQATILDQLDELDRNPTSGDAEQLIETSRVASEHFTSEIKGHLFELLEVGGYHRAHACLGALDELKADPDALCAAALRALAHHDAVPLAASLVLKYLAHVDRNLIGEALPSLIGYANPPDFPFLGTQRRPVKQPLHKLFLAYPDEVLSGLNKILSLRSADAADEAARGITCIGEVDANVPTRFAQTLIAKLVRAKHLMPDLNEYQHGKAHVVRLAVLAAFKQSPMEIDGHLQGYLQGASDEGRAAILHTCEGMLRELRFGGDKVQASEAHKIAFKRLLDATYSEKTQEALTTLQDAFSGDLYDLAPIAVQAGDDLLGAAAIIDDRLKDIPKTEFQDPHPFNLTALQRRQQRCVLLSVQNTCIKWACQAAKLAGSKEVDKLLAFYRGLPEARENLRSLVIENLHELARNGDALNAVLPELYGAMVGSSQLLRAMAAESFGKIACRRSSDLPDLTYEAFLPLLSDPYVIVHKYAVQALDRFWLPDNFAPPAEKALTQLVLVYSQNKSCRRYWKEQDFAGSRGKAVLTLLNQAKSYDVARNIGFWARRLNKREDFPPC